MRRRSRQNLLYGFDWYLRFDGDPDDPLHCKIEGQRKTTTKIVVAGANSPAVQSRSTGCHQRLRLIPSSPRITPRGVLTYLIE